ncbi:hypothetical protein AC249_AIPGENE24780 [Exaiptasia diaphana]|nr:hypothetical protein AC249_AIPGENE24780 [Exaiptasia diaphana]
MLFKSMAAAVHWACCQRFFIAFLLDCDHAPLHNGNALEVPLQRGPPQVTWGLDSIPWPNWHHQSSGAVFYLTYLVLYNGQTTAGFLSLATTTEK